MRASAQKPLANLNHFQSARHVPGQTMKVRERLNRVERVVGARVCWQCVLVDKTDCTSDMTGCTSSARRRRSAAGAYRGKVVVVVNVSSCLMSKSRHYCASSCTQGPVNHWQDSIGTKVRHYDHRNHYTVTYA